MPDQPENNAKSYMKWSGLAFQMTALIAGGALGGHYLDTGSKFPVWTLVLSLAGVVLGTYTVYREVTKDNS